MPPGGLRVGAGVLAVMLCAGATAALDPAKAPTQYVHDVWRVEDGLPLDQVRDIAQTPDGYLWLATAKGLTRFDGARFVTFDRRSTPPLRMDDVMSLCVDREGALWLGSEGGGLARWRQGDLVVYGAADGLVFESVGEIVADREGTIWIGTRGSGLYRFQGGRFRAFTTRDGLANDHVLALAPDRSGDLWIGTRGGVQRLSQGTLRETLTTRDGLSSDVINALHEDRQGALWIGTFSGLHRREGGRLTRVTLRDGLTHDLAGELAEDANGNLWISTFGGGLTRYRDGRFSSFRQKDGLTDDLLTSLLIDREGSLWIGTWQAGLNRLRDAPLTTFGTKEGLSHDLVRAVHEDAGGALWIATEGGGLNRLQDDRFRTYRSRDGLLSDLVFSLLADRAGRLWIGSYNGGLNRLEDGRFTTVPTPGLPRNEFVTCMLEDRSGAVWLGTFGGGVRRLADGRSTAFTHREGLSNDYVWALAEDAAGGVWIATSKGLTLHRDGVFRVFGTAEGLPDLGVWSLHADRDGDVWAGTESGLARVRDGKVFSFTTVQGLRFDEKIMQVLDDDEGHLWLGGYQGLLRVRKSELEEVAAGRRKAVTSELFGVADGMRSATCEGGTQPAAWRGRDGRLWFATTKGVVRVDPRRLHRLPPPPVSMEEVVVDGERLPGDAAGAARPLPPGRQQYEFHYTSLELGAPGRLRFRYRLDGVDDDWVDAGARRTAYYTSVPPGRHLFRVTASRGDDLWNEAAATFEFRVRPRFYQSGWFLAACGAAVALLGWAGHRYRLRRVLEVERVRTRIASDLHDDIGSSLSQIAILSEVARAQLDTPAAPAAEPLARIGALSRESVDAMGDIVWALDPQKDRLAHLAQRIRRHAGEVLSTRGIELRFEAEDGTDRHLAAETRRQVFLVFKEALHNVARHSSARQVRVGLAVAAGRLVLSVSDDGAGFEAANGSSGHGLRSMQRRAEGLHGTLDVTSAPGAGTQVRLAVPV